MEEIGDFLEESNMFYINKVDLQGRYVYVNKLFEERFCNSPKGLIDCSIMDVLHFDDAKRCGALLKEMLLGNVEKDVLELRIKKPNSVENVWTSWEVSVLRDKSNEISGVLCIGSDIKSKESLINSRLLTYSQKLDKILNSITDGFFTLDNKWKITKVNKSFEELSGNKSSEILGKSFWEEYPEYKKFLENEEYMKSISRNETFDIEFFSEMRNKWFSAKIYPSTEGVAVFFQDITRSKSQVEEIIYKNKILTEIAKLQSHQIRRPVATMLGLTQLFEKQGMSEENLELLDLLEKTTLELDEVIHKIVHKANSVIKKAKSASKN